MGHYAAEMQGPDPSDDRAERLREESARLNRWIVDDDFSVVQLRDHLNSVSTPLRNFVMYMMETFPSRQEAEAYAIRSCQSRYAHHAQTAAKLKAFIDNPETAPWK